MGSGEQKRYRRGLDLAILLTHKVTTAVKLSEMTDSHPRGGLTVDELHPDLSVTAHDLSRYPIYYKLTGLLPAAGTANNK